MSARFGAVCQPRVVGRSMAFVCYEAYLSDTVRGTLQSVVHNRCKGSEKETILQIFSKKKSKIFYLSVGTPRAVLSFSFLAFSLPPGGRRGGTMADNHEKNRGKGRKLAVFAVPSRPEWSTTFP